MKHSTPARALSALIAVAGLAAGTIAVSAQTPPPPPPGVPGPMMPPGPGMPMPDGDRMHDMDGMHARMMAMPTSDADFVRSLSFANSMELSHAKYVINVTKNPQVHAYAQRMIDDHSTAAVKLQAATRGVGLRPAPSPWTGRAHGMPMMMDVAPGANADDGYMRMQVPMHRHVLALLQWEEDNGKNAGLKALASNLMPTVQQHLQLAQTYLSEHHLTPLTVPMPRPVPGHPVPRGSMPAGAPNNPAAPGATAGPAAEPVPAPRNPITPPSAAPLGGAGTPVPGAAPLATPAPRAT